MLLSIAFQYGGLRRSTRSIADIYITKPQIEQDYLPHAIRFGNKIHICVFVHPNRISQKTGSITHASRKTFLVLDALAQQ